MKGSRPDAAWKGGRHRKTPVAPGEGDSAAAGGAGVKRGRPRNPPAAAEGDNHEQADVRVHSHTPLCSLFWLTSMISFQMYIVYSKLCKLS